MATQTSANNQVTVLSASWNDGSTAYTAFKLDVNNILTPPTSALLDIGTNTGTYTSRFFINVSGSVGIGTTQPAFDLDVYKSAGRGSSMIRILAEDDSTSAIQFVTRASEGPRTGSIQMTGSDFTLGPLSNIPVLFVQGGAERMRVNTAGNVGIGTTNFTGRLYVSGSSNTLTPTLVARHGSFTTSSPVFDVQDPSSTSLFSVNVGGDAVINTGNLVIGTAGKGIDFGATANSASGSLGQEILDDYEEGTWTPTMFRGANQYTLSTAAGHYTKIGRLVTIHFQIVVSTVPGSGTGVTIRGLPFSIDTSYVSRIIEPYQWSAATFTNNLSSVNLWANASSGGADSVQLNVEWYNTDSSSATGPEAYIVSTSWIVCHLSYLTNS